MEHVGRTCVLLIQIGFGRTKAAIDQIMPWNTIERYGHMLKPPAVKVGDTVKPGQTIGVRGSTGYSTGPHSHYERRDAQGRVMDSSAELGVHRGDVVRAGELLHPASSATADSTSSGVGHN